METITNNGRGLASQIEQVGPHDHLCLIYDSQEEQFAAAIPFVRIGLERGEKCLYIADDNTVGAVFDGLRASGIDVDAAVKSGALKVATKRETYLKPGYFDPDWMIRFMSEETKRQKAAGFAAFRATGEMTWAHGPEPGTEKLMEYEAKLNYLAPEHDFLALCQYNRKLFSPEVILNVIATHPLVIYCGRLCRNPYYVPPDEFLMPDPSTSQVQRMLDTMSFWGRAEESLRDARDRLEKHAREHAEELGRAEVLLESALAEYGKLSDELWPLPEETVRRSEAASGALQQARDVLRREIEKDRSGAAEIPRLDEILRGPIPQRNVLLRSSGSRQEGLPAPPAPVRKVG